MAIMKSVEIMSESEKSFEDAIQKAITRTSKTVDNIRSAYVRDQTTTIKNNKIDMFRVTLKITFEVGA
ncbi:dodecin family protein [Robiginitomaculum antarcticum]|uniref:dodecin family protein n=1 Tax=Robiginitomaculum antarcticum TaxID=437507 RepID=UPI000378EDD0|nr:dodecin family protein [Robiginitomaculum antarcticum]